jgi:hypothetical protein
MVKVKPYVKRSVASSFGSSARILLRYAAEGSSPFLALLKRYIN